MIAILVVVSVVFLIVVLIGGYLAYSDSVKTLG